MTFKADTVRTMSTIVAIVVVKACGGVLKSQFIKLGRP